jgi:hypothetical protein
MLFWLYGFIARVALGEELTPADRNDYRLWTAVFFLAPLGLGAVWLASPFLDRASNVMVCVYILLGGLAFYVIWGIWAHFVAAAVSSGLGVVLWIATLWMAWHGHLWF